MDSRTVKALIFLFASVAIANAQSLPEWNIGIDPDEWEYICEHYWEDIYIPAHVTFDEYHCDSAEIRLRGESSRLADKKSLRVRLPEELPAYEMDKINLISMYEDQIQCRDWLANNAFARGGYPHNRCWHVKVNISDGYYGLFSMMDRIDKDYLRRLDFDDDGNLYKASAEGANLSMEHPEPFALYEKKTNEDEPWDDLEQLIIDLDTLNRYTIYEYVYENFDVDALIDFMAISALISNNSTYYHNYYLYHDTDDTGFWYIFPWDVDNTFHYPTCSIYMSGSRYYEGNRLICLVLCNDDLREMLLDRFYELAPTILDSTLIMSYIDSMQTAVYDAVLEDTLYSYNVDSFFEYTAEVEDFLGRKMDREISWIENRPTPFLLHPSVPLSEEEVILAWSPAMGPHGETEITYKLAVGPIGVMDNGDEIFIIDSLTDTIFTYTGPFGEDAVLWTVWAYYNGYERLSATQRKRLFPFTMVDSTPLPDEYSVCIHPNPFNTSCLMSTPGNVPIAIFDIRGNMICRFAKTPCIWQPEKSIASGTYIIRTVGGNGENAKRLLYFK